MQEVHEENSYVFLITLYALIFLYSETPQSLLISKADYYLSGE